MAPSSGFTKRDTSQYSPMSEQNQGLSAALQWAPVASVVATTLAVLVALFRESIVLWWRSPKLKVTILAGPPDCNKTETRLPGMTVSAYYFRLWITNDGRTAATRVQVFASELQRQHADGSFRREQRFLPMNLIWSHTGVVFADSIAPGMGQHCELGVIFPPTAKHESIARPLGTPNGRTCLALQTEVKPFTGSSTVMPGTYRLRLRVAAANAKPRNFSISISLPGDWYEDEGEMLSQGIGLTVRDGT
jgi:hypothetical protein